MAAPSSLKGANASAWERHGQLKLRADPLVQPVSARVGSRTSRG